MTAQAVSQEYVAGFVLNNGREVMAKVIGVENGAYVLEMPAYVDETEDQKFRFSPIAMTVGAPSGRVRMNFNPQSATFIFAPDTAIEAVYRKQFFGEKETPRILTMDKTIHTA